MELYYKVLLACFIVSALHATRWPLIVISKPQKTIFKPFKNKRVIQSRTRIKKIIALERTHRLFESSSLATNLGSNSLSDVFLDARKQRSTKVHVLLTKADNTTEAEWKFTSAHGFLVHVHDSAGQIQKTIKMPALTIKIKRGVLLCNGKRVMSTLQIRCLNGHGECNGIVYDGDFIITHHKDVFLCINQVELEDYITAVLRTE